MQRLLGAPWQVWAVVALAPLLWFLYEQPGDPYFDDPAWTAVGVIGACLLLLLGSKLAWLVCAVYVGASALMFILQLLDPSGNLSSGAVRIGLTIVTIAQFAFLVSPATMAWVGVRDRRGRRPPAEHAS